MANINKADKNNPFGVPAVCLVYGAFGLGKSSDLIYSFPKALFIAQSGALKPAVNVVGWSPAQIDVLTIPEATKVLEAEAKSGVYDTVVVDDFSLMADRTISVLEEKLKGFDLWRALRDKVLHFRDVARNCGMHVILSAHESIPKTKDGIFTRGGVKLPGKLPDELPATCDLVVRMVPDKRRKGWHAVYRCTIDDPNYITRDRHGVTPDFSPANMAEILRLAGYTIQRPDELEWMTDVVAGGSAALLELPATDKKYAAHEKEIIKLVADTCAQFTDEKMYVRWVLRDVIDRTTLRRARENLLSEFGL